MMMGKENLIVCRIAYPLIGFLTPPYLIVLILKKMDFAR
jgi:hypothetical protein